MSEATGGGTVKNLFIFGDSLSDIGNVTHTVGGKLGKALGQLHVNEINRFSDGRNWTDFLTEWTGASGGDAIVYGDADTTIKKSFLYRQATDTYNHLAGAGIRYINYAQGGSALGDDYSAKNVKDEVLGHLKGQVLRYLGDRRDALNKDKDDQFNQGISLHIIWIGLNDIVTLSRSPSPTPGGEPVKGAGMRPLVNVIGQCINEICISEYSKGADCRFMLINLPLPSTTVRWHKELDASLTQKERTEQEDLRKQAEEEAVRFNKLLEQLVAGDASELGEDGRIKYLDRVTLVNMSNYMAILLANATEFGFENAAQTEKLPVLYNRTSDDITGERRCFCVPDELHPTEAVYEYIAAKVVYELERNHFKLGNYNNELRSIMARLKLTDDLLMAEKDAG
ncbi:SGNH/GDSL hydrolase family protein [Streptomyces sp. 900105245]